MITTVKILFSFFSYISEIAVVSLNYNIIKEKTYNLIVGATGLHLAIAYGNDELAQCLVECGSSVSTRALGRLNLSHVVLEVFQAELQPPAYTCSFLQCVTFLDVTC